MSHLTLLKNNLLHKEKPIVFISDLHFDFTEGKFKPKAAPQMIDDFITFIKEQYADSILCLAGDFFNDYSKTLTFVKELEQEQIFGFFVLGNHDFWNDGTRSHKDIINLFDIETKDNKYFKLLITGRKYYFNDICFIGDTGWTSFRRGTRQVEIKQFMDLPDAITVKDFSPNEIIDMHGKWVNYANRVLKQEEKVLVITHFPMIDFTQEDEDCWWSSQTNIDGNNSWRIYGHTHKCKQQKDNNVSSQRGYENKNDKDLEFWGNQYSEYDFGQLEMIAKQEGIVSSNFYENISKYYSPMLISNDGELESVSNIVKRGYRRCSANKKNFASLAKTPEAYLKKVKKVINGYLKDTFIGYSLSKGIPKSVFDSIFSAIAILESGNHTDIRAFITAAVITGYVYNEMPYYIESMRPLDDYDIIRFWLMFSTMKQYQIGVRSVDTVHKDRKNYIVFSNVEIYLPVVNDYVLTVDEVQRLMKQAPLLPYPQKLLE